MRLLGRSAGWLVFALSIGSAVAVAQEPLTLRQAIELALKHNPEADLARAGVDEAKAGAKLARTQFLPQLNFVEDISRGDLAKPTLP